MFAADQPYSSASPADAATVGRTATPTNSWFLGAASTSKISYGNDQGTQSVTTAASAATCSAPGVAVTSPVDGSVHQVGEPITADYACTGSEIISCVGNVPDGALADTSSAGNQTFTVTATAWDGTTAVASNGYTVVTIPDAPSTPGTPTAVRGPASATVSWTAPASDGFSAITGYVVTPYIGSAAQAAVPFAGTNTTQT